MAQALPPVADPNVRSVVLHCRPRLTFHLGHLHMLNVLYGLLQQDIQVTILVIPYVEHEPENRTYIERLRHDYAITRDFYTAYLGHSEPNLRVVSYDELPITSSDIAPFRMLYREMYDQGHATVRALVDEHQRPWSSPGIDFVPKCLAALAFLAPDATVAGHKHEFISDCFQDVLEAADVSPTSYVFEDLMDLRMTTGMDRTDSVNTYIEVNDQEDFVLYKLHSLQAEQQLLSQWLDHFAGLVLAHCPERARAGISSVHGTDAERIMALSRLLQNVRRMVPYSHQPDPSEFKVRWSDQLFRTVGTTDKSRIERIATPLYVSDEVRSITVYRSYSEGKSGGTVFGVREHSDIDGRRDIRTSVMKVGDALALDAEHKSYVEHIAPSRTGAFLEVRPLVSLVDGEAAIVYEDARRQMGASLAGMEPLHSLFNPATDIAITRRTIASLLADHLNETLYRHGETQDTGSFSYVMNEFLPAKWRVRVDHAGGRAVSVSPRSAGVDQILREHVTVTEFSPEKALARAYTAAHDKVDLLLDDVEEDALAEFRVGATLDVEGPVVSDREGFFRAIAANPSRVQTRLEPLDSDSALRTLDRLSALAGDETPNFRVSAVHGDLHGGNVLVTPAGQLGIIDYGKTRSGYPALYDIAFLMADLKITMATQQLSYSDRQAAERALVSGRAWWARRSLGPSFARLQIFEYESLPGSIQSLGPASLYYGLFAVACLGRLKFDIQSNERSVAMHYARSSLDRSER